MLCITFFASPSRGRVVGSSAPRPREIVDISRLKLHRGRGAWGSWENGQQKICNRGGKSAMRQLKMLLLVMAAAALQSCVVVDDPNRLGGCGGSHRLQVVDLDVSPD